MNVKVLGKVYIAAFVFLLSAAPDYSQAGDPLKDVLDALDQAEETVSGPASNEQAQDNKSELPNTGSPTDDSTQDALDALNKAEETVSRTAAKPPDQDPGHELPQGDQAAEPDNTQPAADGSQSEIVFWQSIVNSSNVADFAAYLDRWPDGTFASLARNRLAELNKTQDTIVEEETPQNDKNAEFARLVEEMDDHFFGRGTPVDYARSFEIASQCAPVGHPKCMFRLGRLLETGRGTNPDSVAAAQWYEKAAEAGERYAMFNLANFYFTGNAVARDLDRAYDLYLRAYGLDLTEAGYGMAMVLMDKNYAGERDPALAAEFMAVAIENGFDTARKTMIENGQSWARDFRLALQRRLKSSGYYKGAIDGDFGPATKTAINRAFGSSS